MVCSKSDSLSEVEFIHGRLVWSKPDFPQRVWGYTDGWFGLNLIFLRERVRLVTDSLPEPYSRTPGFHPETPTWGCDTVAIPPVPPSFAWVQSGDFLTDRTHLRWEVRVHRSLWSLGNHCYFVTVRLQTCSVLCCSSTTAPNKIAIILLPLRLCRNRGIFKGDESHPQMAWSPP